MKIAVYQAPLLSSGSMKALGHIGEQIRTCEAEGVTVLCCPEAILGGLADYARSPAHIAFSRDKLATMLAPLASDTVTTIVGFTETDGSGKYYNAAAVLSCGAIAGVYRKTHPFINRSVYTAGTEVSVFSAGGLTFGIVICYDSNFPEPASTLASLGARIIFIPSNNGLAPEKADVESAARTADIEIATKNKVWVARADTTGRADGRLSYGSSAITDPLGTVRQTATRLTPEMLVQDIHL